MIPKFLLSAVLASFVATSAQSACRGQNLYDNTGAAFKTSVDRKVATIPYAQGNYWEITKNGRTSWIIGTIHLPDRRVSKVPPFFKKKIRQARLFQMEMSLKQLSQMYRHMIKQTLKKGIKKQKRDWWSKLTPAEQKLLTREAKSKGVSPRSLKTATVFKLGGLIRRPKCASTEKKFLDLNLMKEAQKARVPIKGLDNPIKRANEFLALKRSEADHFFVLREELKRLHLRRHYVETMVQMYHRGQAERFLAFESAARKAYVPKRFHRATEQFLQNDILKGRNKEWMPAIIGQMAKGNVVTAIGAAHLPGRLGVLNLLKKNGFSVKKLDL